MNILATTTDQYFPYRFDFKRVESRRKWAFDQLLTLVRNNAIPKDDECITDVLGFFAVHGFFAIKKVDKNRPETLTVRLSFLESPYPSGPSGSC